MAPKDMETFKAEFLEFHELSQACRPRFALETEDIEPCLDETEGANIEWGYILHTAWAARILARTRPERHVDISSSTYFAALVSAFVPVEYYEFGAPPLVLDGLAVGRADLTALEFGSGSVASLSCMHTIEHIGLGRYGDPLDPEGDIKAMAELGRVLAPGGLLLLVAPIGEPRITFNSQRLYSVPLILENFADCTVEEFAIVTENILDGGLVADPPDDLVAKQRHGGLACFALRKKA